MYGKKEITAPTGVSMGDDEVSFKRPGQSTVVVATVLGRRNSGGMESVWLDRIVHEESESFDGWSASGAISTVLTRENQSSSRT